MKAARFDGIELKSVALPPRYQLNAGVEQSTREMNIYQKPPGENVSEIALPQTPLSM